MYLSQFKVRGYRSFTNEISLTEIGPTVILYGLNNAGKSNLLRALQLFHRLAQQPLDRLLDRTPRNAQAVYAEFLEDEWMFNLGGSQELELSGTFEAGSNRASLRFRMTRDERGIRLQLLEWSGQEGLPRPDEHAAEAAFNAFQGMQLLLMTEMDEQSQAFTVAMDAWSLWEDRWDMLRAQASPGMTITSSAGSSLPTEIRNGISRQSRSLDLPKRRRAAWALEQFSRMVPGLPEGRLEPVETGPAQTDDFGWVGSEGILPLDQMGSGSRALFALLATLALAETPSVGLEEPESHLNAFLQRQLCTVLTEVMRDSTEIAQLFIVTHSLNFADPGLDLRLLERVDRINSVSRIAPADLRTFEPALEVTGNSDTPSLLGYDGSVRLPDFVREGLGAEPGQFVYFVPDGPGKFHLVNEREMAAGLGEE